MEQRSCIKFCFKNGIKCNNVVEMIKAAFGDAALNKTSIYKWYKRFEEGREDYEDDERIGRPNSSANDENIEEVKKLLLCNKRITIREVAAELDISFGSCQAIFADILGKKRLCEKLLPKVLDSQQKECRKNLAHEVLCELNEDPEYLQRLITGAETWLLRTDEYANNDMELVIDPTAASSAKKARKTTNVEALLIVFFDCNGLVHHEFLPTDRTIDKQYYLAVLHRLLEAIRSKRSQLWQHNAFQLHYYNATALNSLLVREFLTKNCIIMMPQPACSMDLAPCEFFLFPTLEKKLKAMTYDSVEELKTETLEQLNALTKAEFQQCFVEWRERWHKCYKSNGDYFDNVETNKVD